uniref:RRM domain-containing protein n=1 Tax=Strigamia maritima TaxID=126957 RepID=T1JC30_STRMM
MTNNTDILELDYEFDPVLDNPDIQEKTETSKIHSKTILKSEINIIELESEKLKKIQHNLKNEFVLKRQSRAQIELRVLKERLDCDSRSIYVGNVDYQATAEELKNYFCVCGPIKRVTIASNRNSGHPKGFGYIEFDNKDSAEVALVLHQTYFRKRQIKVNSKRTNRPGMSTKILEIFREPAFRCREFPLLILYSTFNPKKK